MAETQNRIPLQSITVVRDGKFVNPEVGKSFPFTADELADIERLSPGAVRKPVDENATQGTAKVVAEVKKTEAKADGKKADAKKADEGL